MEYIVFCICSIIIARYVEKKSRVISIAHDILFIFLSIAFFFATNNSYIANVAIKVVGNSYYEMIHGALTDSSIFIIQGFSTLFIIEFAIMFIIAMVTIVAFIKGFKKMAKKIRVKSLNDVKLLTSCLNKEEKPSKERIQLTQHKYLLDCQLLN